ncbi:SPOR domain-containing protein [Microbacterium sp. H1-D42]|uniref:SPOR domain-containing protein n=1 Tax=Microbacterium sp. H1-D42 TaxID=2925844 RepID=UPI001F53C9BC|nr:SPOR domain-containing protein [Microbacterium sp. H1-D42]UNK72376.1 SPOR domain-containing protein [Microbacterium sp. H1-D42]
MTDGDEKYWYNLRTGDVEFGMQSASVDRVGPFDTAAEASRAPEIMRERSNAWAEEEAAESGWDASGPAAGE